jgi:integrase
VVQGRPPCVYFRPRSRPMESKPRSITSRTTRDFIAWGFCSGMRKGEIPKLEWSMFDRGGPTWVLNLPGSITKNGRERALGLQGEVRSIIERRIRARRLNCPLIFHRTSKGQPGQPLKAFDKLGRNALAAATLPPRSHLPRSPPLRCSKPHPGPE